MEAKKIVVILSGPPHSGKSVFTQGLRKLLMKTGLVGVIEGCPDGEGGWAGATDQGLVGALRTKGKFTQEFVSWVIESIQGCPQPIALVDVGGVRSPENERIFQAATHFIVLANPAKVAQDGRPELEAWEAFGRAHGCQPIALLESILHGETRLAELQNDCVIRGTQSGLERGVFAGGGPVMEAILNRLLDLVGRPAVSPGELEASVHTGHLADQLGIPAEARDARLGLRPWHAPAIRALSQEALGESVCRVWGAGPAWLSALVAAHATQGVALWDIRLRWVDIPELAPAGEGSSHLVWRVEEVDGRKVVSFSIPGGVFDPARLDEVAPPELPAGQSVVLSGRGPHWLVAAIARAYAKLGHEVAVAALHESAEPLPGGGTWSEKNPTAAPAVVVTGAKLGEMIAIPVALINIKK